VSDISWVAARFNDGGYSAPATVTALAVILAKPALKKALSFRPVAFSPAESVMISPLGLSV
jgi:hypothetical protein